MVTVVDTKRHRATVKINGKNTRTIPVSTGDADHRTRNGIKVVMEKYTSIDMDAATTGVDSDDPGYYNLKGVKYAMRVTNSGEFLHAAPWSVASQGNANVSHGCVGMSTDGRRVGVRPEQARRRRRATSTVRAGWSRATAGPTGTAPGRSGSRARRSGPTPRAPDRSAPAGVHRLERCVALCGRVVTRTSRSAGAPSVVSPAGH